MRDPLREAAPVLGHAIAQLGQAVEARDPSFAPLRAEAAKLDRYYIPTRYPNGLPEGSDPGEAFDPEDARAAIATAERVIAHAEGFVNSSRGKD